MRSSRDLLKSLSVNCSSERSMEACYKQCVGPGEKYSASWQMLSPCAVTTALQFNNICENGINHKGDEQVAKGQHSCSWHWYSYWMGVAATKGSGEGRQVDAHCKAVFLVDIWERHWGKKPSGRQKVCVTCTGKLYTKYPVYHKTTRARCTKQM